MSLLKTMKSPIKIHTLEAKIKRKLRSHLRRLGFQKDNKGSLCPPSNEKEAIRALHLAHRQERLIAETRFIQGSLPKLLHFFASGNEVIPERIRPSLQLVTSATLESQLFRLASLTWSIPVSRGYGRRMRFLVWDEHNGKIIGIIALGDPVFNLKVRDNLIGWTCHDRKQRLVNVMDAFVLGAIPPYNMLLGGKLVACLIRTKEIRDHFSERYKGTLGIISQEEKHASLVMVTTTSALGRSSVYNRLKMNGIQYLTSIGYTSGWGHFHIPEDLFRDMRLYLEQNGHSYAHNHHFGEGPNWRLRTVRAALELMKVNADQLLRHGVEREVFMCKLATNAEKILRGQTNQPIYKDLLSVSEVSQLVLNRWIIPRASYRTDFRKWDRNQIKNLISIEPISYCSSLSEGQKIISE